LKDLNKWVKISAYKNLGPFIATLEGGEVNEKLFENYIKMTEPAINNLGTDNEVIPKKINIFNIIFYIK
jgi:hypothetical protein